MQNAQGVKVKSLTNSYTVSYINLINFGDDDSRLSLTKLGAQSYNFFIANKPYVSGRSVEPLEIAYAPLTSGQHVA